MTDEFGNEVLPAEFMRAAERHKLMRLVDRWVVQTTFTAVGRGLIRSLIVTPSRSTFPRRRWGIRSSWNSSWSAWIVPARCPRRSALRSAKPRSSPTWSTRGASSVSCTAWAASSRSTISASGVASFSNLKNLPLDYLKIDGSLTQNLARDSVNQAMVTAMIKLARSLKFKVIAEQVEEASAADFVRRIGVDFLQGYAIGRPKPLLIAA